jgi:hypothetical protein
MTGAHHDSSQTIKPKMKKIPTGETHNSATDLGKIKQRINYLGSNKQGIKKIEIGITKKDNLKQTRVSMKQS